MGSQYTKVVNGCVKDRRPWGHKIMPFPGSDEHASRGPANPLIPALSRRSLSVPPLADAAHNAP
jgi:hypothetical protein